jgi:ParB family transcriptional regulator, chromosome partitioning protein
MSEIEPKLARRRGLGMGLSALLGGDADLLRAPAPAPAAGSSVPIELLSPSPLQPRRHFAEDELEFLAESIRARGVMQPLLVRPVEGDPRRYEIVAGERRWRAAQRAGVHELPVVVHRLTDREALEVALLENVQRQDLSPIEEADGYRRLIDEFGHTQAELAGALGKSRSHIANLLRLLGLPPSVRSLLDTGALSAGHARALLMARDAGALARKVLDQGLNVRQTERLVQADKSESGRSHRPPEKDADTRLLESELSARIGLKVTLKAAGNGGALTITYRTLDQLDEVLARLRNGRTAPAQAADDVSAEMFPWRSGAGPGVR